MAYLEVTSADGTPVAYAIDGDAGIVPQPIDTVVFQHGVGFNRHAWSRWLPTILGAGLRTIRIDMRGHGSSGIPPRGHAWSTEALVADVLAVLDREKVGQCHFVGESWGGTIGLALAGNHLDRVATLTVMSTTYDGALVEHLDKFPPMISQQGISTWSEFMLDARFMPDVEPKIRDWAHDAQINCPPHVIAEIFEYIVRQSLEGLLSSISTPTLILAPQASPFVKPKMAEALFNKLPDAELLRFPRHRHGLVLSGAANAAVALLNFIYRRGRG